MTVESRRHFEELLVAAREEVAAVRARLNEQWVALAEKAPNPAKVVASAGRVHRAFDDAHATFRQLLALAPRSAALNAEYAAFLGDLANDRAKSRMLQVRRDCCVTGECMAALL